MSGLGKLFGSSSAPQTVSPPAHLGEETHASVYHPAKSRDAAEKRYGKIVGTDWPDEGKWMVAVDVDPEVGKNWFIDGDPKHPVKRIHCNKDMADQLRQAIQNMKSRGVVHELKSYDGCLNIRNVRGSSLLSCHAYGLALDINCDTNPLGGKSSWSVEFVKCWTDSGFNWGGNFKSRKDPMHFSFAWE